jgi:hypothetical protein
VLLEPEMLQTMKATIRQFSTRKMKGPRRLDRGPRDCVRALSLLVATDCAGCIEGFASRERCP